MIMLAIIITALVVYGLGPDLNGDVAKDMWHLVKERIKKLMA